ncbi:hypothetical protein HYPSUDRAFT_50041, partial [Hypholoma sublateritium FD-334 SS-4]
MNVQERQVPPGPHVKPTRMRYRHLWKAVKTLESAFKFDPFVLYMNAGNKAPRAQSRAQDFIYLTFLKTREVVLTVEAGTALVVVHPEIGRPQKLIDRVIEYLSRIVFSGPYPTAEQKKRADEQARKLKVVVEETIGNRLPTMMYVDILATDSHSQGRGYGGVLLEAINDLADSCSRALFLQSSNILNEAFYNSHGFQTVGTYYLGDDNPEWTGNPIPIQLMVREPNKKCETLPHPSNTSEPIYIVPNRLLPFNHRP